MTRTSITIPPSRPSGLTQLFGYREGEAFWLKDEKAPADVPASDRVYYQPSIAFTYPLPVRVTGRTYLTPIEITSAKPIATFEGMTVAATKNVGKGQVYYFGTNLGASIASGQRWRDRTAARHHHQGREATGGRAERSGPG